jgi:hypothetical protein
MADKFYNLVPPLGGIEKKISLRQKEPYTTPDALNVRPVSTLDRKTSIGSRAGLGKKISTQLGSGNPVVLMDTIEIMSKDKTVYWADYFNNTSIDSIWSIPSWLTYAPSLLTDFGIITSYGETGLVRSALTNFDTAVSYSVEMDIVPYFGEHFGLYRFFLKLDDTTPANTNMVLCELTLTGTSGAYSGRLVEIQSNVGTETAFTSGTTSYPDYSTFKVLINGTAIAVSFNGTTILSHTLTKTYTGNRIGFSMVPTVSGGACLINGIRIQYSDNRYREMEKKVFVASSNGIIYKETGLGTMTAVSSNLKLSATNVINSTDRLQKLYIADFDEVVEARDNGAINSSKQLSSVSISDWTSLGLNIYDFIVVITSGTGATAGNYTIASISSGYITLNGTPGTASGVVFYVQRAPKIYDPKLNTLTLWTATTGKGNVPIGCNCIALYRDRLVLAKEHLWYMSRQDDPLDWDTSQTDAKTAVAGQSSDAGQLGAMIKALIPFGDDYLLFMANKAIWRLRGDPAYGGQLDMVSTEIGCIDKNAYCLTPENAVIFLSLDGLYGMGSVASSPESISRDKLPYELLNVDISLYYVSLKYDTVYRGVHIYLTPKSGGQNTHWWFDWVNKGFWKVQIPTTMQPYCLGIYNSDDANRNAVILGCKDGYIRYFDEKFVRDEGTAITDYLIYSPLFASDEYNDGQITEIVGELSKNSGAVNWSIKTGNSHQECLFSNITKASGTWSIKGLNYKQHPRCRGVSFLVKIERGDNDVAWGIETIQITTKKSGVKRVL